MSNKSEKDMLVSDAYSQRITSEFAWTAAEAYRHGAERMRDVMKAERDELVGVMEGIMELRYSSRIDQALDEAAEVLAKHKPE